MATTNYQCKPNLTIKDTPCRRAVITGLGVVSPNGIGLDDFRESLMQARSGVRFVDERRELNFACQVAGIPPVTEDLTNRFFTGFQLRAMGRGMIFAGLAAIECWQDAGLAWSKGETLDTDWDSGAIFGTGIGGVDTIGQILVPMTNTGDVRRLGSTIAEQVMCSANSALLGGLFGLGSQVSTNSSACSTGTEALIMGARIIRQGLAKRMLVGGAESDSLYVTALFDAMKVTSRKHNDQPRCASRPLSATARGFVPAGGAGALLLEDLETAKARGARIYAEVLGGHINCGGQRNGGSMTASNPTGVQLCIQTAISDSGVTSEEIKYINGHLTGTMGDTKEISNLIKSLNIELKKFPRINATKSLIGHALGASGAIECVATILQMHHGFLHGSINCEDLHPDFEGISNSIVRQCCRTETEVSLKTSFGFGDVNACVIFRKFNSMAKEEKQ